MYPILNKLFDLKTLTEIAGVDGFMPDNFVGLFTNDVIPGPGMVPDDFVLTVQEGLVKAPGILSLPYLDSQGFYVVDLADRTVIATGAVAEPFNVYGWMMAPNATGIWWMVAHRFPAPIFIDEVGKGLSYGGTIRLFRSE